MHGLRLAATSPRSRARKDSHADHDDIQPQPFDRLARAFGSRPWTRFTAHATANATFATERGAGRTHRVDLARRCALAQHTSAALAHASTACAGGGRAVAS